MYEENDKSAPLAQAGALMGKIMTDPPLDELLPERLSERIIKSQEFFIERIGELNMLAGSFTERTLGAVIPRENKVAQAVSEQTPAVAAIEQLQSRIEDELDYLAAQLLHLEHNI